MHVRRISVLSAALLALTASPPAHAQTASPAAPAARGTVAPRPAGAPAYVAPRTPWGAPDLQGTWTSDDARGVPLQRAAEFGERRLLTEAEFGARAQRDAETRSDVSAAAGTFVGEIGTRTLRQTSLVVAPANGRIPSRTAAAEQRMAALTKAVNPLLPATAEDRSLFERCISRGPLAVLPTLYGNGLVVVQAPDAVVISHEMIHEARVIPLDGRRPVSDALRGYMGYAIGRWEGDTLVVETRGFTDKTAVGGTRHTGRLRVVERFTRTAADTITYEAEVDDPETWTSPWKVEVPLSTQPGYRVYPYECHEGNMAVRNMLSAARAEERVIEDYVRKGLTPPPLARPGDADILPPDPSFGRRR